MGESKFRQSVRKLPKNQENVLFDKTYFEESNIHRQPLIWSQEKIKMKIGEKKKGLVWFWEKCTTTDQNLRKSVT